MLLVLGHALESVRPCTPVGCNGPSRMQMYPLIGNQVFLDNCYVRKPGLSTSGVLWRVVLVCSASGWHQHPCNNTWMVSTRQNLLDQETSLQLTAIDSACGTCLLLLAASTCSVSLQCPLSHPRGAPHQAAFYIAYIAPGSSPAGPSACPDSLLSSGPIKSTLPCKRV